MEKYLNDKYFSDWKNKVSFNSFEEVRNELLLNTSSISSKEYIIIFEKLITLMTLIANVINEDEYNVLKYRHLSEIRNEGNPSLQVLTEELSFISKRYKLDIVREKINDKDLVTITKNGDISLSELRIINNVRKNYLNIFDKRLGYKIVKVDENSYKYIFR